VVSFKSILLSVDIDGPSSSLIKFGMEVSRRFDAKLTGCAAAAIIEPTVAADTVIFDTETIARQHKAIDVRLEYLKTKFFERTADSVVSDWRNSISDPTEFLTESARMADLVVAGSPEGAKHRDPYRSVNLGDLMLQAGRPVLVAANGAEHLLAHHVVVAWKDCREARRVVTDAMPFLIRADEVVVVTAAKENSEASKASLADVISYLGAHGVKARSQISNFKVDGQHLFELARDFHSDLIVAGAYGHSRLREWAFGGVTRSLLNETNICRFMSN
jgi:nucleotide-binding universal stress UspA family protein